MASKKDNTSRSPTKRERHGPRITRVYTRTGDAGETRLVGGQALPKHHPRIEAYGTVDELSVAMGRAREELDRVLEELRERLGHGADRKLRPLRRLADHLQYLQNLLFTLGGDLATRLEDRWDGMPVIGAKDVRYLERLIDGYNADLPPLTDFVLPGGGPVALELHACRVVCRRAERTLSRLIEAEPVGPRAMPFLNRLSDLFFVLSRWVAAEQGALGEAHPERIWDRALKPPAPPRRRRRDC